MSHKCNDVFVEFGLYFAKVRLVMAKIATLEDKQKLTAEFVWKHVKAEVLAASRVSDNRFAQLVNNALQGDKFDKSHKTDVFLRTLYDSCREDQVEAVKNKIKRDKQLRLATANGGPRNEALVVADLDKRLKVRKCFAWIRTGKCSKGAECRFAHQESQQPANTRTATKKRNRDADSGGVDAKIVRKEPKVRDGDAKKVAKATRFDPGPQKEAKVPRTSICWHWKAEVVPLEAGGGVICFPC